MVVFFNTDNAQTIIQCKHYLKSGIKLLISDLEKKELPKIKKLNPARYIVVTSCPLSPMEKTSIKTKLSPYILSEVDIFGKENLNDLLKQYPKIETAHYKLWLTSIDVLHVLLNNSLLGRSQEYLKNTILKQSKFLVQTEHYPKALQMVQERNSIIITGSPGVGKTTLANQLSIYLVNKGYEFYCIDEDIKEAEEIFQEGKKQLFYFDDFLGSNILEALNMNNRDSKIIRFIERIKNSDDKKFILTSRAHILNQQIARNERYHHANINNDRYELEIAELSDLDKAKILYNHIWHSNLPEEYIDAIYYKERYKKIIEHQNYNPRIIEFITNNYRIQKTESSQYWQYIQDTLNNPEDVWKQIIDYDLDDVSRYILLAIILNGNLIREAELLYFYNSLQELHLDIQHNKIFRNTIEPLVNSIIIMAITKQGKIYSLFNPSIADYILKNYLHESRYTTVVNNILHSESHALYIDALIESQNQSNLCRQLANDKVKQILVSEKCTFSYIDITYLAIYWDYIDSTLKKHDSFSKITQFVTNEMQFSTNTDHNYFIIMLELTYKKILNGDIYPLQFATEIANILEKFLNHYLTPGIYLHEYLGYRDFLNLYELLIQSDNSQYYNLFKERFFEYIFENDIITDLLIQHKQVINLHSYKDYDSNITKQLIKLVFIEDLGMNLNTSELNELISSVNIDRIIEYNENCQSKQILELEIKATSSINELFER